MGRPFRRFRHGTLLHIGKLYLHCIQLAPRWIGLSISSAITLVLGLIVGSTRKIVFENIEIVYGDTVSQFARWKIYCRMLVNQGITLCDAIKIPSMSSRKFYRLISVDRAKLENIRQSLASGAVAIGGHLSCFELQSHILAKAGIPVCTIGAKMFSEKIETEVCKLRGRNSIAYLTRNGSSRNVLKALKSGSLFASLLDQDATDEGVYVPFLGTNAFTPTGPIKIAIRNHIPLYFFKLKRLHNFTYRFDIEGPIEYESSGEEPAIRKEIATRFNRYISDAIREMPSQWVWMHRRWKRKENL